MKNLIEDQRPEMSRLRRRDWVESKTQEASGNLEATSAAMISNEEKECTSNENKVAHQVVSGWRIEGLKGHEDMGYGLWVLEIDFA